ncbi:MAG TPA: N-6 DNA methylase [Phycisphaerales bacterium]|nr:N-6 DNA methylase [Phycisphaerales bacterium]
MESPQQLLDAAYEQLGYAEGDLFDAVDSPSELTSEDWINKGEWLALAKTVGAEKVFFVDNNPVIVFATSDSNEQRKKFEQIWNMARPPLLFLASPGELAVYNLNEGPDRNQGDWEENLENRQLKTAKTIKEVSQKLQEFRREQIETGRLFEDKRFGDDERADKALISDLQTVRKNLLDIGLAPEFAHSLIGRSIFIRYLEDRGVLKKSYFKKIVRGKPKWREILNTPVQGSFVDPELENRFYPRVLSSKDFTYALFKQLGEDFNGDMFPNIDDEKKNVEPLHLHNLQDFLCGNAEGDQLFFFAYKFDIIPIELISSIYEEFYNTDKSKAGNNGSHYTPPALVEFLLGQVLSPECLDKNPKILDPACGSGIFLVESFRRIVRHKFWSQNGRRLSDVQLRKILREQISGIDINGEAVRVAAFSLYLAFLHYQKPPDILEQLRQGKKLPNLKYKKERRKRNPEQHYDTLLEANSFDVISEITHDDVLPKFTESCADIIVGNPPWGSPGTKEEEKEGREAMDVALQWCENQEPELAVGGREWSQAFIHRAVNLLHEDGQAALLVSSGVLFKSQGTSRDFRKKWLTGTTLNSIVNFAHVRDIFFKGKARQSGAQSPFVAICFTKRMPAQDASFKYWSAKKTAIVKGTQSVLLSNSDLKQLNQNDVLIDDDMWKIYWWGNHRDERLIGTLRIEPTFDKLSINGVKLNSNDFGQGFTPGVKDETVGSKLHDYGVFPTRKFVRYGDTDESLLRTVPKKVHRFGKIDAYEGCRLLVKQGITESGKEKGRIISRLATKPFCFTNSIHSVKFPELNTNEAMIALGIFWSSLARYYFWLTAGAWIWHNQIYMKDVEQMPIRLPENTKLRDRIIGIVNELQRKGANTATSDIYDEETLTFEQTVKLERELDDAIFDLYGLNEAERDLIRDMCEYGLELFYNNIKSEATKPVETDRPKGNCGVIGDIHARRDWQKGFEGYIRTFLQIWNRELEPDGEFRWQLIRPGRHIPMVAMVFSTQDKKKPLGPIKGDNMAQWNNVLRQLDKTLLTPVSKRVYIDGLVRAVSDTDIMIIKRNERRLWTRSMAREDAEATLLKAMNLRESTRGQR